MNPLTKLVVAIVTSIVVVLVGGVVGPVILGVLAVLLPGVWAGVLRQLVRTSVLLALPLAISAALVNLFFFPGPGTVLFEVGPITATTEGAQFATEIVVRVLVIAGALTLFYLTTRTSDLVIDLERRGVSPRIAFIARSAVTTVPAMVERASTITDAQRARGLDTQGSVVRRVRGIVPMVGPTIMGAINEVEERTLALEARGFTRPGRRTLLWSPIDTPAQRLARWLVVAVIPLALVLRAVGLDLP
ncbi:MAG: energy-coupling factor transporter transmembrane component T [Candidatus Limnocylindrales bacterium]